MTIDFFAARKLRAQCVASCEFPSAAYKVKGYRLFFLPKNDTNKDINSSAMYASIAQIILFGRATIEGELFGAPYEIVRAYEGNNPLAPTPFFWANQRAHWKGGAT